MKTITIGRSNTCDIVIADDGISRIHAEISLSGGQYVFKDVSKNGSTINGTFINNQRVVVAPGANILLANRVPLPWAQIYAQLPIRGVRPYDMETRVELQQAGTNNCGYSNPNEHLDVGWKIVAFLFPIIGFILYFCWKSNTPNKASNVANWSWAGFITGIVINILSLL